MNYSLEVNNISKAFTKSDFKLQQVSLMIPKGTIMGFVGENGAGKTTTIGCILGTLCPDTGTVKIFDEEITDETLNLREDISVVYDGDNFPTYLTANQLANILRSTYKQWDDKAFNNYLSRFGLNGKQKIKTFSKGMTMKLAIAVALSHNAKLLILDEATSGIDPIMREDMLDVFLEFVQNEEHSILLSSHITSDLEKVADYITFIHDGKIILTSSKDDLAYKYAVMRCTENQFNNLDKGDIVAYRKKDFQTDVLISDEKMVSKKYKDIIIDHVSIDEIMLLLVRGNRM